MLNMKRIIAAAISLVLTAAALPSTAICAETHTVNIYDFNGNVMDTLTIPHGEPVDFRKIDISSLSYHIDDYTQIGFIGWSTYPVSVTEDMNIYALYMKMSIKCTAIPDKREYYSDKGDIRIEGLKVTITKETQLPQKDENGNFLMEQEILDISDTCTAVPATLDKAFAQGKKAQINILPPGSSRAIVKYNITRFEGLGDVTFDESVDSSDASEILEIYAKSSTGSDPGLSADEVLVCDINRDEAVNSSDSSLILDFYAKSATSDVEISWDDLL